MTLKQELEILRGEPILDKVSASAVPYNETSDFSRLCKDPVVSVRMITYNHEKYIAQAIDGVMMQQTDFEYELIVSDDCSTDRTRQIAEEYQKRFPDKIRVLWWTENQFKYGGNGIRAWVACRGELVALCEGDDYWIDPLKLQKQVDAMRSHTGVTMCFADVETLYQDSGRVVRYGCVGKSWQGGLIRGDVFAASGYIAHTGTMLLRKSAYDEAVKKWEIFKWALSLGDKQLMLAMAQLGDIWCSRDVVSVYRIQSTGAMMTNGDRVHRDGALVSLFFELSKSTPSDKSITYYKLCALRYRARIASRMSRGKRLEESDAISEFGLLPKYELLLMRLGRPYLLFWYIRRKARGLKYRISRLLCK